MAAIDIDLMSPVSFFNVWTHGPSSWFSDRGGVRESREARRVNCNLKVIKKCTIRECQDILLDFSRRL